jgi:hypothetical protein
MVSSKKKLKQAEIPTAAPSLPDQKVYTLTRIEDSISFADKISSLDSLKIVFYNPSDKEHPVKSFYDFIPLTNKKNGKKFHGVRATKFGMIVPKNSTHCAIAAFGGKKIDIIYSFPIPDSFSKMIVVFGKKYQLVVRRSNKNLFIAFGETKSPTKSSKRLSKINEQWVQL